MMPISTAPNIFDPVFPQLQDVLNPEVMCKHFQHYLISKGTIDVNAQVESCLIGEKRHKPGISFILSYSIQLYFPEDNSRRQQTLTARLYPCGVEAKYDVADLKMQLWLFPDDRKLIYLSRILNPEFLKSYSVELLSFYDLKNAVTITSVRTQVLHYLPEKSCMIRYQITFNNAVSENSPDTHITLYGKNYPDDSGREVYSIMRQLVDQAPIFATPLHYDSDFKTLWQAHIPGIPLEWSDFVSGYSEHLIQQIAYTVVTFQSCTLQTPRRYGLLDIDKQLKDTINLATRTQTDISDRVHNSIENLQRIKDRIDWSNLVLKPVHLDLKLSNFLINNTNVALIDMDCACLGDPLADLGSLIAHLYMNGLRAGFDSVHIEKKVVSSCLRGYIHFATWPIDLQKLYWYTAAALMHEVLRRSLRQNDSQRMQHLEAYLTLSEHYCHLSSGVLEHA